MASIFTKKNLILQGPPGTGKTWLAVAHAVQMFERKEVDRIILSRPAVEAGERLGFLPGDMREKVDPYLRPLYDALYDVLAPERVERGLSTGVIDSFHLVDLAAFVEDRFGVRLDDTELNADTFDTLDQLAAIIRERQ